MLTKRVISDANVAVINGGLNSGNENVVKKTELHDEIAGPRLKKPVIIEVK